MFFKSKALTLYTFPGIAEAHFPSHIISIPALCYEKKNLMERTQRLDCPYVLHK